MNDDLISRKALLEELKEFKMSITGSENAMALMVIDETKKSIMRIIDMQPTALDMADIMAQLERCIDIQLQIIARLNDPVYKYGFTKSLEAYQQCRLILKDAIHEN